MDEKACCCPSRPMVRVLMPATQSRPYRVDLLLCGHHFRVNESALRAAGAVAYDATGAPISDDPAAGAGQSASPARPATAGSAAWPR